MSAFVVDASTVAAAVSPDEAGEHSVAIFGTLTNGHALVPMIWHAEVANMFRTKERKAIISTERADRLIKAVFELPVRVIGVSPERIASSVTPLSRQHGLTLYDALHVAVALAENAALATLDRRLASAATRAGLPLVTF